MALDLAAAIFMASPRAQRRCLAERMAFDLGQSRQESVAARLARVIANPNQPKFQQLVVYARTRIIEDFRNRSSGDVVKWVMALSCRSRSNGVIGSVTRRLTMMSLPFVLFACGLGAAWTSRREAAMGFWVAGVLVLLVLFRFHATDVLNLGL